MALKRLLTPLSFMVGAFFVCQNFAQGESPLADTLLPAASTQQTALPLEPFLEPISGKKQKVVSAFGKRHPPESPRMPSPATGTVTVVSVLELHEGADYAAPVGTPVRASRAGKVIFAGFSKMYVSRAKKTEQHRLIIIRHVDGMSTRYVHLSGLRVRPGQSVEAGQTIGTVAESDELAQPVLHFEIRGAQGQALDPVKTIAEFAAVAASSAPVKL